MKLRILTICFSSLKKKKEKLNKIKTIWEPDLRILERCRKYPINQSNRNTHLEGSPVSVDTRRHVVHKTNGISPRGGRTSGTANIRQGRLAGPTLMHVASWRARQRGKR